VLRSYFPMAEEKDQRVFGAMDGGIRGNMFRQVQERWMEWQKLFLSVVPFPEISAARAMPLAISAVPNPEIHNGLAVQMIDEVRHSTIQNLKRLYMNHYIDPAGFDGSLRFFHSDHCGTIGRQFAEGFITRRRHHRGQRLLDDRGRDSLYQHAVRRHAGRGRRQRGLPAPDGVSFGPVRRVPPHQQRVRHPADGPGRRVQPQAARA
jgi:Methane/Phenol/Toluene Hydroxylase